MFSYFYDKAHFRFEYAMVTDPKSKEGFGLPHDCEDVLYFYGLPGSKKEEDDDHYHQDDMLSDNETTVTTTSAASTDLAARMLSFGILHALLFSLSVFF